MDLVVSGYIIHQDRVLLVHHKKSGLWLPPGGHMDQGETPDDALRRELREELNIDVEILNTNSVAPQGNIKKQLAVPFYVNVHSAGDHDHCCFFYVCRPKTLEGFMLNGESLGSQWLSVNELEQSHIPLDVRNIALKAFEALQRNHPSR